MILKKSADDKKHAKLPNMQIVEDETAINTKIL